MKNARKIYAKAFLAGLMVSKRCNKCGQEKLLDKMITDSAYLEGVRPTCKECDGARSLKYRAENPDACKQRQRDHYARNRDTVKTKVAAYRENRREYYRELTASWKKKNPEAKREQHNRRRARKMGAVSESVSPAFIMQLLKQQKHKCVVCGSSLKGGYHIDHIVPLAAGGKHAEGNLQALCPPCNLSKGAKDPIQFMQSRGYLL